jgi:hypothetical protein
MGKKTRSLLAGAVVLLAIAAIVDIDRSFLTGDTGSGNDSAALHLYDRSLQRALAQPRLTLDISRSTLAERDLGGFGPYVTTDRLRYVDPDRITVTESRRGGLRKPLARG